LWYWALLWLWSFWRRFPRTNHYNLVPFARKRLSCCRLVSRTQCNIADVTVVCWLGLTVSVTADGFRYDYLRTTTPLPNIDALRANGVTAEWMQPIFPSKTFPNHYTLVTGLYAETHGIISKYVRACVCWTVCWRVVYCVHGLGQPHVRSRFQRVLFVG
jgi:hypothetical protein